VDEVEEDLSKEVAWMPELLPTVLLERQASNELVRKGLWEVLSKAILGRGLVVEDRINGRENMICLYDICVA
jgi:hypothetical protein